MNHRSSYHPQHADTIATVTEAREAANAALHAEAMERFVGSHSDEWEWRNEAKWAAIEAAAELIPGLSTGDDTEEHLLAVFGEVAEATDHALARKWGLPW